VLKDGHLFLSLMADGGIYEFAPMPKKPSFIKARDTTASAVFIPG
jgi:hypothetical protein